MPNIEKHQGNNWMFFRIVTKFYQGQILLPDLLRETVWIYSRGSKSLEKRNLPIYLHQSGVFLLRNIFWWKIIQIFIVIVCITGKLFIYQRNMHCSIVNIIHLCCASADVVKLFVILIINKSCLWNKSKLISMNYLRINGQGKKHKLSRETTLRSTL